MKRLLLILLSLLLGACAGTGSPQAETNDRDSAGSEPAGTTATAANSDRPIFFIASHDDAGAARAAETLFSRGPRTAAAPPS